MEVEIQGMPQSIKPKFQTRVKSSKTELAHWKKTAVRRQAGPPNLRMLIPFYVISQKDLHMQASRAELMSSNKYSTDEPYSDFDSTSDRTRLLAGTELLQDGTRRLEDSNRLALETEELGGDILRNLRQQREQIENSRDMVRNMTPVAHFVCVKLTPSVVEPGRYVD